MAKITWSQLYGNYKRYKKKESDDLLYSMRDRLYSMMKFISPYSKEFYEVVNEYNEICRELYVRNHEIDKD